MSMNNIKIYCHEKDLPANASFNLFNESGLPGSLD